MQAVAFFAFESTKLAIYRPKMPEGLPNWHIAKFHWPSARDLSIFEYKLVVNGVDWRTFWPVEIITFETNSARVKK